MSAQRKRVCICLIIIVSFLVALVAGPFLIHADNSENVIRVGWYESAYNITGQNGRRSGYAYEYQMKIAAYTGWKYEYVDGSWTELLEKLKNGEIDLLSDVSYTDERAEFISYPSLPMGAEEYYIFISPDNKEVSSRDYSTLNGKKVGANKNSLQETLYKDWAKKNNIKADLQELTCTEGDSLRMLESGELDAYVTVDAFKFSEDLIPFCLVGSSDFYFAVNQSRPDILTELNNALGKIQEEDRYYNQKLFDKYINTSGANALLTPSEQNWLSEHGKIRVGYQDNYLAFCAKDEETGELTGALKDYLDYASDCLANAKPEFEAVAYPTASAAIEAVKNGEVDCMFPANLNSYDEETLGVVKTLPLMRSDIYAVTRQNMKAGFYKEKNVTVAVNEGNPNYEVFLVDHFPEWTIAYYPDTAACLEAVRDGKADCLLISSYRYNNIARQCERYRLKTDNLGTGLDYCFAVANGSSELYTILSKIIGLVPDSTLNAALSFYVTEDAKLTFFDVIADNLPIVVAILAAVLLVIIFLLIRSIRAERRAERLIAATETDDLTGLYNRKYFFQYANRRYRANLTVPMDAIVLNIDQFHSVNALNGRDFGDQVLRVLGSEIHAVSDQYKGIAGRFDADRFDIYCRHTEAYPEIYERLQNKLNEAFPNANIRLRMGVMPWQEKLEPVQLFDRARTACSMARGHYKEHLIIFDDSVHEQEIYEQRLLNEFRRALDENEFEIYYQPQYDIRVEPPKLVSAEALVRWKHPELGVIPPNQFIPLFERNGQISMLDQYVWEKAVKQAAYWRDVLGVRLSISVNLSRVDVFDPALEGVLDKILKENGLNHEDLKLEVTESAYTENADHVVHVVERLQKIGYEVEMDDFGSGYSSLNMLSTMPINVLKMDRAFIQKLDQEENGEQFVALILGIAENLHVPVIAEGVETEEQLAVLKRLGCALVQGYYFSKPLPPDEFEETILKPLGL